VTFVTTEGVELRDGELDVPDGRIWYAAAGSGGIPLLCLHGGPGIPHDYLEPLAELASERLVVFYDQLGCGKSAGPSDPNLFTIDRHIAELDAVRDALGLAEVHILGQSWGGTLAISYALRHPRGVRSYIFSSPSFSTPQWEADAARLRAQLPADVRDVLDRHEAHEYTSCPEYVAASLAYYKRHVCRTDPWPDCVERAFQGLGPQYHVMWGATEFRCTGTLKDFDVMDQIHTVETPSLFTCGRHDEATPETIAECAQRMPRTELAVFEDSGHMPHAEEPERYNAVVSDFLRGVEQGKYAALPEGTAGG
jgi:proline-specific peptidase